MRRKNKEVRLLHLPLCFAKKGTGPVPGTRAGAKLQTAVNSYYVSYAAHASGVDWVSAPLPFVTITTLDGAEIKPGKRPYTRIKPLPLTNGHGRGITVTPERTLLSVGEWPLHISEFNSSWI